VNILAQALALIFMVESNRGEDKRDGDDGSAVGPFQIHKAVVDDVNRILGVNKYKPADRLDFVKSQEMAEIYLTHYVTFRRLGHEPTIWDYCRTWNGGPLGPWRNATLRYVERIKERYYELSEHDVLRKVVTV
jgi:hypothetical protein